MKNLTALLGLLLIPAALSAGEKASIVDPVCAVPFTGAVSAGYESSYIFRGLDLGGSAPWMAVDTNWKLFNDLNLDLGAWYINPTDPRNDNPALNPHANDELDLYATFHFPLWVFKASLGTILYHYPELGQGADDSRNVETNFGLTYGLPWFDLKWLSAYDWDLNYGDGAWYHEVSASRSFDLSRCLSAGISAGAAFYDNYNFIANPSVGIPGLGLRPAGVDLLNGFSHAFVTLGLTWAMNETAALDLYMGGNMVSDDLETLGARGDQVHGGASISVSF